MGSSWPHGGSTQTAPNNTFAHANIFDNPGANPKDLPPLISGINRTPRTEANYTSPMIS